MPRMRLQLLRLDRLPTRVTICKHDLKDAIAPVSRECYSKEYSLEPNT
jgi:hypothetical protein